MPKFIDYHKMPGPMPPEMVQAAVEKIKAGQVDEFGVKGLNVFVSETDAWCLTEAANPEAIHKSHEAMGIKLGLGDVHEVQSLV